MSRQIYTNIRERVAKSSYHEFYDMLWYIVHNLLTSMHHIYNVIFGGKSCCYLYPPSFTMLIVAIQLLAVPISTLVI